MTISYIAKPNEWFDEGTIVELIDDYRHALSGDSGLFRGYRNGKMDEEICTFDEFEVHDDLEGEAK